ncbi:hypothetical protein [Burkholderia ubonensis]|uniref:hypothetical protein n=1 Tax=Burkholderia ubonensis TaxID=101571 RepID=UPI000758C27F|nr:hypothetical protein [Burkholderia ubonensis]KVP22419.1 hypothetical protein WJ84_07585 [Burkholderia ubonensis]
MQRITSLKVKKVGKPKTFEVEKLSFSVSEKDEKGFLRDPERFLTKLLTKNGYTVKSLHIVSSELKRLMKAVQMTGDGTTSTWHCVSPPKMKCRRIVVKETN